MILNDLLFPGLADHEIFLDHQMHLNKTKSDAMKKPTVFSRSLGFAVWSATPEKDSRICGWCLVHLGTLLEGKLVAITIRWVWLLAREGIVERATLATFCHVLPFFCVQK